MNNAARASSGENPSCSSSRSHKTVFPRAKKLNGPQVDAKKSLGSLIGDKFKLDPDREIAIVVKSLIKRREDNPDMYRGEKCLEDFFPPKTSSLASAEK